MELDLMQRGALLRVVEELAPQWIVNGAALSRAADCERDPELAQHINSDLPAELADMCATRGIRCVHISTDLVFDGAAPRATGYREEDTARPCSVYGHSKLDGERRVLRAHPAALVVRLPLLCGDSGGRGLGASDSVRAAVAGGLQPQLFSDEFRTPLDVRLAARALLELVNQDVAGLLHVAGPERLSRLELGRLSVGESGAAQLRASLQSELDCSPPRPADVSLDASRARSILRLSLLSPRITLAEAPDSGSTP